jgi:hypothetical protein
MGPSAENFERLSAAATSIAARSTIIGAYRNEKPSDATSSPEKQPVQIGALAAMLKKELGGDPELVKQALADFNAMERQNSRNHFESRLEYVRQVAAHDGRVFDGLVEYGLQTLKWSFLLNAGAIAIIVAYVGGAIGRSPNAQVSTFAPLLKAVWPFTAGCISVLLSGAAGYFHFCRASACLASAETLHNFTSPSSTKWPGAKFQKQDETPIDFSKRYSWKVNFWRKIAIGLALGSGAFFVYGVYRVLSAASVWSG